VIVTLGPWASLGAFDMLQRSPMGDEPRPRRSQYTFFLWTAVVVVLVVLLALAVWRGWA
jgi:hypothetical protein